MKRGRRDSVAFTVVVAALVLLGAVVMAVVVAPVRRPRLAGAGGAARGGPGRSARRLLHVARPLRARAPQPARRRPALGSVRRHRRGHRVPGPRPRRRCDRARRADVVAPVTEEVTKGAFLVLLLWWRRHELDGVLDGIVYAGMVGVGFAYTENILYLAAAYDGTDGLGPGGTTALTSTFVVRCLISPFAHPFFTAFIGIGVGLAIASRRTSVRLLAPVVGLALAARPPRRVELLHRLRHRRLPRRLRHADVPGVPRRRRLRGLPAPVRAPAARRRPCRTPRTVGCCPPPTSRGSSTCAPAGTPAAGRATRAARSPSAPCGSTRPPPSSSATSTTATCAARHRPTSPCAGRSTSRSSVRIRPYISFPGQVVPTR